MLSKEEIENINELKRLLYSNNLTQYGKRKLIATYEDKIEQLESDKQKLIKELEEDIKKSHEGFTITLSSYDHGKRDEAQKILSILKGENNNGR